MTKFLLKVGAIISLGVVVTWLPLSATAQETAGRTPAAEKKAAGEKKARPVPFQGTLAKVDKSARSITVGKRVFQITAETRLFKNGGAVPAVLEDGVVGQRVTGSYLKSAEGSALVARSVYFGGKGQGETTEKKNSQSAQPGK